MPSQRYSFISFSTLAALILVSISSLTTLPVTQSFSISRGYNKVQVHHQNKNNNIIRLFSTSTPSSSSSSSSTDEEEAPKPSADARPSAGLTPDHVEPEDAIIHIAPKAMVRLRELRAQTDDEIVLRMGVRNGGCSGLSYVMDFSKREDILEDDAVDEYDDEGVVCVVDAKSMLYLFGLELDYSDELIGGGFKFFNPNAEESCGCGSSFGV